MLKALLLYVKYPSVAAIIGVIWVGSGLMILFQPELPIFWIVVINMVVSLLIGIIGFRVDRR